MNNNYADFNLGKTLKYWDETKVELKEFVLREENKKIRYFKKIDIFGEEGKIISRYAFSSFREPFIIEPWNQILIDEAVKYGTLVDKNKEDALKGKIENSEVIKETRMSVAKMINNGFKWVARSQMVCHPESLIYGEIDEIWYHDETDTFFVGDTKTSSSVDKLTYWYQLGIYVEILQKLNPGKKISSTAMIDWVKIKKDKWVYNHTFNKKDWQSWVGKEVSSKDEVYNAKWIGKKPVPVEEKNLLKSRDLELDGILELVRKDIKFINKYSITSSAKFEETRVSNNSFIIENKLLQSEYDILKEKFEDGKWNK